MAKTQKLLFHRYTEEKFLDLLGLRSRQALYLHNYLKTLQASTVLQEPKYFDRDYLAEFSAFYSVSAKGYPNICERLHFFSENINRRTLNAAAGGSIYSLMRLQKAYLGFIVKRPIPAAPLGRTVLKWFPDNEIDTTPRVITSKRKNYVHFAGVELYVEGLAWQQQDTGVGACATVSLWSMLHSSAFDDHHAIPTTADITRNAHKKHSFGTRIFPSQGLNILQIDEAIKEQGLIPLITEGDVKDSQGNTIGFSKDRFSSTCASFIRSGYPVMIIGRLESSKGTGQHAVCNVGFRSCIPSKGDLLTPDFADSNIEIIYAHDDNLGPNVRLKIANDTKIIKDESQESALDAKPVVSLQPKAPKIGGKPHPPSPTDDYGKLIPTQLVVAAHNDIRTSMDTLHKAALKHVSDIMEVINHLHTLKQLPKISLAVSSRLFKVADYIGAELEARLKDSPKKYEKILSNVRLSLSEDVNPLSLHIAIIRISLDDATVLVDILYDTTDSDRNHPIFACVAYNDLITNVIHVLKLAKKGDYGVCVKAY